MKIKLLILLACFPLVLRAAVGVGGGVFIPGGGGSVNSNTVIQIITNYLGSATASNLVAQVASANWTNDLSDTDTDHYFTNLLTFAIPHDGVYSVRMSHQMVCGAGTAQPNTSYTYLYYKDRDGAWLIANAIDTGIEDVVEEQTWFPDVRGYAGHSLIVSNYILESNDGGTDKSCTNYINVSVWGPTNITVVGSGGGGGTTYTNNTDRPGLITGSGIGTNLASLIKSDAGSGTNTTLWAAAGGFTNQTTEITVSAKGIRNSLSSQTNNGAHYGPDTPGTTTSGLQEAWNAANKGTQYGPTAASFSLRLGDGYFYYTNALVFSNLWTTAIAIRGNNNLGTKLVYAGSASGINCIDIRGGDGRTYAVEDPLDLPMHVYIENVGFSAINETTNVLLRITNVSHVNIYGCNFTGWRIMTNSSWGSALSINGGTNYVSEQGLVGLVAGNPNDHTMFVRDTYFAGLAVGGEYFTDHLYTDGMKFAFVGFDGTGSPNNMWPTNHRYYTGAGVIRSQTTFASVYRNLALYSVYTGVYINNSGAGNGSIQHLENVEEEGCDHPLAANYPTGNGGVGAIEWLVNRDDLTTDVWRVTNSPSYTFIDVLDTVAKKVVYDDGAGRIVGPLGFSSRSNIYFLAPTNSGAASQVLAVSAADGSTMHTYWKADATGGGGSSDFVTNTWFNVANTIHPLDDAYKLGSPSLVATQIVFTASSYTPSDSSMLIGMGASGLHMLFPEVRIKGGPTSAEYMNLRSNLLVIAGATTTNIISDSGSAINGVGFTNGTMTVGTATATTVNVSDNIAVTAAGRLFITNVTDGRVVMDTAAGGLTNVGVTGVLLGTGAAATFGDIQTLTANAIVTNTSTPVLNGGSITNLASTNQVAYTNTYGTAPTFLGLVHYQDLTTNATFQFLPPAGVDTVTYQTCVILVTNSAASTINVIAPANTYTNGTWNVTNAGLTTFTFFNNAGRWTNAIAFPIK